MSVFGIVCETNPIHNGHKHLITSAKDMGADAIVCVMSGNTVQRGEFAIADKYIRAEALLRCGADLVIELPFPWSSSSAEYFARAAVYILQKFCDTVIFGSECGNIDILKKAAMAASRADFKDEYTSRLSSGERAAGAYFDMLEGYAGIELSSNDLLGVEYIKASEYLSSYINFETIRRRGDGYTSSEVTDHAYPSAMSIRKLWRERDVSDIERYMPAEAIDLYRSAIKRGAIVDTSSLDAVLLTFFRSHTGSDFKNIVGASGGIANRICEMSHKARSADELLELVRTKRYTDSSIRRVLLYCLGGVEKDHVESLPEETLLLAANKKGRALLSSVRKNDGVKVYTKPSDLDMTLPQNILSCKIDSIYTMLYREILPSDTFIRKGPYIV